MESIYDLTPEVTAGATPSTHTPHRTSRPPSVAGARVVVTAITGLFLYIGVRVGQEGSTTEIVVLLALLGVAAACTALAWWQATMGGLALVLVGVALAVFFIVVGGDDGLLLAGIFGVPYLLAGLLLFLGSVRSASA
jgi:hypothetical protein